jgi:hypothetical protein
MSSWAACAPALGCRQMLLRWLLSGWVVCLLSLLQVQLQLLTATVKLFLKKPTDNVQRMIQLVLSCATNETDNPDLRDRAYVYWRLLSTDPEVRPRPGATLAPACWQLPPSECGWRQRAPNCGST